MKDITVVVYTMKNCPFCFQFKQMLDENNIPYIDRDIDEHIREYEKFCKITENDMVPALLILEEKDDEYYSYLYAPERDYETLNEAISLVKEHYI